MSFTSFFSPIPSVCIASISFGAAKYYDMPIYKIGLYNTGVALGFGVLLSGIMGCIGYYELKKDPSSGLGVGLTVIAPTAYALYNTAIFWSTLLAMFSMSMVFSIHNLLMFKNFLL